MEWISSIQFLLAWDMFIFLFRDVAISRNAAKTLTRSWLLRDNPFLALG